MLGLLIDEIGGNVMGFGDCLDGMETTELSTNGGSKQLHLAKV